ncbi:MAG: hypothetical protein KKG93_11075, partial [Bacteroidetes bacterium]|nr:hypothetical protein [Bacteroidota bacterium]
MGDVAYIPEFIGDYSNTASDFKYSLMDDDWLPDIFVGRFSVENTTQLSNIINKETTYENGDWSTYDWTKKAVFMASEDNYTISEGTHNYVISNYLEPEGYTSDKLYSHTNSATTTQVINAFNNGRIYGVYSGHGSQTSWADGPPLSQSQVRGLTNGDKLPLVFSFSCLTGQFNYYSECFGETWLRESNKAAIGFWGSSRETQWWPDDRLEKCLFSSIYEDVKTSFGGMTVEAKIKFLDYYPISSFTAKDYFEKYNILGDPTLNYAHSFSGTIAQNTTWGGSVVVTGNVTVNSGVALTINPGTRITFKNGTFLTINGTLNVNGTASSEVLFDFQYPQWNPSMGIDKNGIKINSTGIANISHAEIRRAYTGIFVNEGVALIDNCLIRNGYSGIHLYRTNYSSSDTYITNSRIYGQ